MTPEQVTVEPHDEGELIGAGPGVTVLRHPLARHHLTRLRDKNTEADEVRRLVRRLSALMAAVATDDLRVTDCKVQTPLAVADGVSLTGRIGLIPILRAGLGMVEPLLDLIPEAEVWHLGLYRDEAVARPVQYYSKLPDEAPVDVALVLDPMLATGGSAAAALAALRDWGVRRVKLLALIASAEGLERIQHEHPETQIYVCAVDAELDVRKYIVPGLGDAGDRMFNTTDQVG